MQNVISIILAIALFTAGWVANGWRKDREAADLRASLSQQGAEAISTAYAWRDILTQHISEIDSAATAREAKNHAEISDLRSRVDAGSVRLRLAARCPAADLPAAPPGAVPSDGAAAELDPSARSDYFALREALKQQTGKISDLQAILRSERNAVAGGAAR